ncbi:MAG: hypothetical protein RML92_07510 [Bacteroidia bacterium]|nr:hypothetical protein [Bacteroidia bacterium]
MSTRREYYKSLAERLQVPQEIEPVPIKDLLLRSPQNNIYEIVFNVSRRAEQILSELTDELRTKLQDISAHEESLSFHRESSLVLQRVAFRNRHPRNRFTYSLNTVAYNYFAQTRDSKSYCLVP